MSIAERWHALTLIPAVRTTLVGIGFVLMVLSPLAGILPGPGGLLVFAAGLALALKYSDWAKRKYVEFKRAHPKKGAWTDWGMRRRSAQRRRARDKEMASLAADPAAGAEAPLPVGAPEPACGEAALPDPDWLDQGGVGARERARSG